MNNNRKKEKCQVINSGKYSFGCVVVCVLENESTTQNISITFGKEYIVRGIQPKIFNKKYDESIYTKLRFDNFLQVYDDQGILKSFPRHYFIPFDEFRVYQIDRLLNEKISE